VNAHENDGNKHFGFVKRLVAFSITIHVKNGPFVLVRANGETLLEGCDHRELRGVK
jgi:hypothetical protein